MRIHTNSDSPRSTIDQALRNAIRRGNVAPDVHFVVGPTVYGSRSHAHGVEVQLGTYDSSSGPTRSRHFKNTGTSGADHIWAATWDEWGWFLAEVFNYDPSAKAGPYVGREGFDAATSNAYTLKGCARCGLHAVEHDGDGLHCITCRHGLAYAAASAAGRYQGD